MIFIDPRLFSIVVIMILGAIVSYEDIKIGKIRNKYLLFGLLGAGIINIPHIYFEGGLQYLNALLINAAVALFVGFILWHIHLWTAGDGKLFFIFSLLVPLTEYTYGPIGFFPSYILLVNTFIPLSFVLLVKIINRTNKTQKRMAFNYMISPYNIAQTSVALFGFVWLLSIPLSILKLPSNYFVNIVLLFIVLDNLGKLSNRYLNMSIGRLSLGFVFLRFIFEYKIISTFDFAINFVSVVVTYLFLRHFVLRLGYYGTSKTVKINDLKEGMVPMEKISSEKNRQKNKYEKQEIFFVDLIAMFEKKKSFIFDNAAKGLTKEQIKEIQKLDNQKKLNFDKLLINQTLPFAPFMFLGVLLTIFTKGSILIYLAILLF